MDQQAKSLRVSGVPYFIIESDNSDIQPIAFSGAQPVEVIKAALEEAADV